MKKAKTIKENGVKGIREYYLEDVLRFGKRFPSGCWKYFDKINYEDAAIVTRIMIEEVLQWSEEEMFEKLTHKTFSDNKLSGMLQIVFNNSPYEAINSAYPGKYKPWQFAYAPNSYWTLEKGIEATKWLIEEKLKWTDEEVAEKLRHKTFSDNKLSGMLVLVFNSSPYEAINSAYPGKYKPWQFTRVTKSYWTLEKGIEATKWLIEEKLKWTDEKVAEKLTQKSFFENGLSGMLELVFNSSPYEAINGAYPGKYKPWQLTRVPNSYWTLEKGIEATKWLIEEKLKWTDEKVAEKLTQKSFFENGLSGMLELVFNSSPYEAINGAYPGKYKPWQLTRVPNSYWTLEKGIEATKWLIEEKLKWTDEEVAKKLRRKTFFDNKLSGMLVQVFNNSPYEAINSAYPGKYVKTDFFRYCNKY